MEINKRLAFIEQLFDEFERLVDSLDRNVIVPVPDALKSRVSDVTCDLINHINALEAKLTDRVWDTGHVAMPEISERLLGKYQRKVRPARNKIQKIFAELDPETAELFRLLDGPGSRLTELRHVRQTFESGIEKMEELIQDCPDMEEHFLVQPARAIIDSPLIRFEPDDWIVNAPSLPSFLLFCPFSGRNHPMCSPKPLFFTFLAIRSLKSMKSSNRSFHATGIRLGLRSFSASWRTVPSLMSK